MPSGFSRVRNLRYLKVRLRKRNLRSFKEYTKSQFIALPRQQLSDSFDTNKLDSNKFDGAVWWQWKIEMYLRANYRARAEIFLLLFVDSWVFMQKYLQSTHFHPLLSRHYNYLLSLHRLFPLKANSLCSTSICRNYSFHPQLKLFITWYNVTAYHGTQLAKFHAIKTLNLKRILLFNRTSVPTRNIYLCCQNKCQII